jgi:type IV secretion system protein VirB1
LLRQPSSLDEAIATARSLEARGYNFSVGVAQVNHANLKKYGLDTYEQAFSICGNLLAGSRILAQCYADAGGVWGRAFSCYYSGDFTTGYRDGYVQRVLTSLGRGGVVGQGGGATGAVAAIPVQPSNNGVAHVRARGAAPSSAAWRVAIRSSVLGAGANAVVTHTAQKWSRSDPTEALHEGAITAPAADSVLEAEPSGSRSGFPTSVASSPEFLPSGRPATTAPVAEKREPKIFVPQVSDLKTPPGAAPDGPASPALPSSAPSQEGSSDAAFVF